MADTDVLKKWAAYISLAEDHIIITGNDENAESGVALAGCIEELAAEVRALRARVAELVEVERKAIEQSEYIQSHGLTEFEMARLKARVEELVGWQQEVVAAANWTDWTDDRTWEVNRQMWDRLQIAIDKPRLGSTVAPLQPDDLFPQED